MKTQAFALAACTVLAVSAWITADDKPTAKTTGGWTLDEALTQLHRYPKDPYLQYVAMQLARRENRSGEIGRIVEMASARGDGDMFGERPGMRGVDLFSIFSGASAVQESLQLEKMHPEGRLATPIAGREQRDLDTLAKKKALAEQRVKVADLVGPTIKSHPWKEMLAGKKPDISPLARCVPEDFYFAEFRSVNKLLEAAEISDLWGAHWFSQVGQEAKSQLVNERLRAQLAVETNPLARPFYDSVVEEVAVAGNDLFMREGSDVTLLFRFKQPALFKKHMDDFLVNAQKRRPDAKRSEDTYNGIPFVHTASTDREVRVFSAYPKPDLHVRSNSRVAFQRIIDAMVGKTPDGKDVRRLGDSDEFAYIRTLMPRGAKEEDAFIYLSDPFIRRMVGPQLKLTERRRMICYNHLRMIGHASLMHATEQGKPPRTLEELNQGGCSAGIFGEKEWACPDGGRYTLSADGRTGLCSHHGHVHSLTPCCEIPVREVNGDEAQEFKQFLDEYNRYWRTYFDPIAVRLQIAPDRYRVETIILPLIDNSIYTGLARTLGGKPEALDALPVPKRNIFSLNFRVNKQELMGVMGLEDLAQDGKPVHKHPTRRDLAVARTRLQQLAIALHSHNDAVGHFPAVASHDEKTKKNLLSWRVHLLPYIGEESLYKRFRLDEPWDSEHNKKLIAEIPTTYRPDNDRHVREGKTRFVAAVGERTAFPPSREKVRLTGITDGSSHTIMLVESNEDNAVVWTKPDDWTYDPKNPLAGLGIHSPGAFLAVFADGSVRQIRETVGDKLTAILTRDQGEVVNVDEFALDSPGTRRLSLPPEIVDRLKLRELLSKGIGNQFGLHIYDSVPLVDFSLPRFLGMMMGMGSMGEPMPSIGNEEFMIAFLVASLNAPTYIAIPVLDTKVVDEFLVRLDEMMADYSRNRDVGIPWLGLSPDYYQFPVAQGTNLRCFSLGFGPLKWRLFYGRIGNGLYIASKAFILDDLLAMDASRGAVSTDRGPEAHAMVRMRPKNWNQVLADYRLGWAENNRQACLHNLGPLSSLARETKETTPADILKRSQQTYGVQYFCPDGGEYIRTPEGKSMCCSVHGSAQAPRQEAAPSEASGPGKLLKSLGDMTMSLTFLEDGLHAVVTIERR